MGAKTEGTKVVEETKVAEETQVMDAAETVEEVDPWKENVKFTLLKETSYEKIRKKNESAC